MAGGRMPEAADDLARRDATFPTMTFSKLSNVANVTLADYGPKGIAFSFSPKYLGKPKRARTPRHSKSRRS